jgi:hypothetical protein
VRSDSERLEDILDHAELIARHLPPSLAALAADEVLAVSSHGLGS